MPSISGLVQHAGSRNGAIGALTAIPNISLCLYNPSTSVGLYVKTTSTGAFTFNSVPAGTYVLVETGQSSLGSLSPVDFTTATTISAPTPSDPPYSSIVTPIANTNTVDSLSPNTLNIVVAAANITGRNFTDSTIENTPIFIPSGVTVGANIITGAGNGIWGTLPNGTPVNTVPPTYPYSSTMTSGLAYRPGGVSLSADDFTMINIITNQWFFASNHTTFDETSSMIKVNGGNPNVILFYQTISVTPNTYYLASCWLLMVTNAPNTCLIGFRALASNGTTQLFYGQTSNVIFGEWGQIGQVFNTQNNSTITLQVLTMSTVGGGNDFLLDDVALQPVAFSSSALVTKSVDKTDADINDVLTYTVVITPTSNTFSNSFQDTIPIGTTFNTGSVMVNGVTVPANNPITGFTLPNISANQSATVTFKVTVVSVPDNGQLDNSANYRYSLAIIPGNTISNTIMSNTVVTLLKSVKMSATKLVDKPFATTGDTITYTVVVSNTGNIDASDVIFIDTIPQGTTFIADSVFIDGVNQPIITPNPPGIPIGIVPSNGITTITFQVKI